MIFLDTPCCTSLAGYRQSLLRGASVWLVLGPCTPPKSPSSDCNCRSYILLSRSLSLPSKGRGMSRGGGLSFESCHPLPSIISQASQVWLSTLGPWSTLDQRLQGSLTPRQTPRGPRWGKTTLPSRISPARCSLPASAY